MSVAVAPGMMSTLAEREALMKDSRHTFSGFTHRPSAKLALRRMPRTMLNIECNHVLRNSTEEVAHGFPTLEYQLWLEAGKHNPPFPEKPDEQYNSNVWRNFRRQFGFHTGTQGRKVNEVIASMYPINLPAPSKVGKYNYGKFLSETKFIQDPRQRQVAIERTTCDEQEFKDLKAKTDARNPPLDEAGQILPPSNYHKYQQRMTKPARLVPVSPHQFDAYRDNLFEYRKSLVRTPQLTKLSFKENNPEYNRVLSDLRDRERTLPTYPPAYITERG